MNDLHRRASSSTEPHPARDASNAHAKRRRVSYESYVYSDTTEAQTPAAAEPTKLFVGVPPPPKQFSITAVTTPSHDEFVEGSSKDFVGIKAIASAPPRETLPRYEGDTRSYNASYGDSIHVESSVATDAARRLLLHSRTPSTTAAVSSPYGDGLIDGNSSDVTGARTGVCFVQANSPSRPTLAVSTAFTPRPVLHAPHPSGAWSLPPLHTPILDSLIATTGMQGPQIFLPLDDYELEPRRDTETHSVAFQEPREVPRYTKPLLSTKAPVVLEDAAPAAGVWFRARPSGMVTFFNPHMAHPLPSGTRLQLACKVWKGNSERVGCQYIDPFSEQSTPCDSHFADLRGWKNHFKSHAIQEREYLKAHMDASPDRAVAIKDPEYAAVKRWACKLCGTTGRCSVRYDPLKRHQKSEKCRNLRKKKTAN